MRKIGLDLGTKTCGIAISDSSNKMASGLHNFRYENNNLMLIIAKLKRIINDYNHQIDEIIIGYPTYNMSGDKCKTSLLVDKFIQLCTIHLNELKIIKVNENYTTTMATNYLLQFDLKASQRRKHIDQVAATFILQSYLDKINIEGN